MPAKKTNDSPERRHFTCRFDAELIERCEAMAKVQRTTIRSVIEQCILFGLRHLDEVYRDIPAPQPTKNPSNPKIKKKSGN